jgi:hypothetical protein
MSIAAIEAESDKIDRIDRMALAACQAEIGRLREEELRLKQRILSRSAIAQVGELIEWDHGSKGQVRRGRIEQYRAWNSGLTELEYFVRVIRQDGSEGDVRRISPWRSPRKAA